MNQVTSYWSNRIPDPLPENIRGDAALVDLPSALSQIHFPDSWDKLKAARHRLAFDEIFYLQLGVQRQKRAWKARTARVFESPDDWFNLQSRYATTNKRDKRLSFTKIWICIIGGFVSVETFVSATDVL